MHVFHWRDCLILGALSLVGSACSSSSGGGSAAGDSGSGGTGAGGAADSGVGGGTGGGPPCTIDTSDPSAIVRALSVEGGTLVEAPAPASSGSHPSVANAGCSQIAVDRGEPFVVPFAFTDTDTPVGGCLITVDGATNHIQVDAAHCDGGLELAGELPLHVTVGKDACPGTFTLQYAAQADAPAISAYLSTQVTVTNAIAEGAAQKTCVPPEPAPFTGITAAHNFFRTKPLVWDDALVPSAQHIADVFASTAALPPDYPGYGANLIGFGEPRSGPLEITPSDVVWAFVYPGNQCLEESTTFPECCNGCAAGDVSSCMQDSQVVWSASSRLGCAVAPYANPTLGGNGQVWVCVYDPPGNQPGQTPQ